MNLRQSARRERHYAVILDSATRQGRVGVTRNVSTQGILLNTPSRFAVGDELRVSVLGGAAHPQLAKGRVVRVEETAPTGTDPWRYRLAVALDEQLDLLAG